MSDGSEASVSADLINVYCDESCHLENDRQWAMTLGAVWCPAAKARGIADDVREIKTRHGFGRHFEAKWTKVSPAGLRFYEDLLAYFFRNADLHFRAVVASDKPRLRHEDFDQTHDTWYYKMYFQLLAVVCRPNTRYAIYLDIKDTRSAAKIRVLHEMLCNNIRDFERKVIVNVQAARSREIEQLQLADFLTGVISYANRGLTTSPAKSGLVQHIREVYGHDPVQTTPLTEEKVNIFRWEPQEVGG